MSADSGKAIEIEKSINFIDGKILEIQNSIALLNQAKNGYISEVKKEILSKKAGFSLD